MKRPHSAGTIRFRPKPTWDSTTHDLGRYRLSKDDLQIKLKSRQPKPLDQYPGPSNLVKMLREDGTPYVLGTKIFEQPVPDEKVLPVPKRRVRPIGKENELHHQCDDDGLSQASKSDVSKIDNVKPVFIPRVEKNIFNQGSVHSGPQLSGNRHIGVATMISSQGHSTCISDIPVQDTQNVPEHNPFNNSLSIDSSDASEFQSHAAHDKTTIAEASKVQGYSLHEQPFKIIKNQGKDWKPKSREFAPDDNTVPSGCASKLKGGAVRIANKPGDISRGQEISPSAPFRGNFSPDRSDITNDTAHSSYAVKRGIAIAKEQTRERDLVYLSIACEEISSKMKLYESAANRVGKWDAIVKQEGTGATFTEFLLKVTGRLFEHLSDAEHSRELLEEEMKSIKKVAEDSRDDIAFLRSELERVKGTLSLEIKQVGNVSENSRVHLQTIDEEQKSLAAQVLSLSRSYEFQCVTNMLSSAFCRNTSSSSSKSQHTDQASNSSLFEVQSPEAKTQSPGNCSSPWTRAPPASRDFLADLAGDDSLEDMYCDEPLDEPDQPRPPPKPQSLPRPLPRRLNGMPLSPVHESPLESTPVREAYEARTSTLRDTRALPPQQPILAWSTTPTTDTNLASVDGGRRKTPVHKETSSPNVFNQSQMRGSSAAGGAPMSRELSGSTAAYATLARSRTGGASAAASGIRLPLGRLKLEGPSH
jgi:hypothetical protein